MDTNSEWLAFSRKIYALRLQNSLSQKELAKELGIGAATLQKLERGELPKRLGCETLLRICKTFGIGFSDLFREEQP